MVREWMGWVGGCGGWVDVVGGWVGGCVDGWMWLVGGCGWLVDEVSGWMWWVSGCVDVWMCGCVDGLFISIHYHLYSAFEHFIQRRCVWDVGV